MGGRFYLAAYSQNVGATGLTFYDDEVTEFFSPHSKNKNTMHSFPALSHSAFCIPSAKSNRFFL